MPIFEFAGELLALLCYLALARHKRKGSRALSLVYVGLVIAALAKVLGLLFDGR